MLGTTTSTTPVIFPNNTTAYGNSRAGQRVVLEDNTGNNWYGLGMNTSQLIYMAGTGAAHLFKVANVLSAQIDSNGVTLNSTAGTSNALNVTIAGTTTSLTANEVTYLSGVTSGIQMQLNGRLTLTGNLSLIHI